MIEVMARKNRSSLEPDAIPEGISGRGLSGADLEGLVLSAKRSALIDGREAISRADMQTAIDDFIPSAQGLEKEKQELAAVLECTSMSFLPDDWRKKVAEPDGRARLQERMAAIRRLIEEKGEKLNVTQGALVSIDNSGAVRAMVGGADYADSQFDRASEARRQPGSAFKPFVFLAALEQGRTPDSVRNDAPIRIGKWSPENYNGKYYGKVTLATALAKSLNSVAAQLTMEVGPEAVVEVARRLGGRELEGEPIGLVHALEGVDEVAIVDAVFSGALPGTVHEFEAGTEPLP